MACHRHKRQRAAANAEADDGVGLPPGFDFENPATMGMEIVSILAMQLDGNFLAASACHSEGSARPGAVFDLKFPRIEADG